MAMSDEQFEALVDKIEIYSQESPKRYQTAVALLAVLGYAYIFLVLAVTLALIGLMIFLMVHSGQANIALGKLGIVLIIFVGTILRAMWVTIGAPQGIPLSPQQAPALFDALDSISTKLNAPRFHHVLLVDEFNAAVAQVPKFGIFGWQVNYLLLGLPLMQSLSPQEFEAVIAHEMGHLSGNHSRFSGWVYRVRLTWLRLLSELGRRRHKGAAIFTSFFQWYAPYFSAYSFVLARANEYEADRCAAAVTGARTAAEALLRIPVQGRLLEDIYWPSIYEQSFKLPEPPAAVFANLTQAARQPVERETMRRWVDGALREMTETADTHPSLTDRLAALGYRVEGSTGDSSLQLLPRDVRPPAQTATEAFLGPAQGPLTANLDHLWRLSVMDQWRQKYDYALRVR